MAREPAITASSARRFSPPPCRRWTAGAVIVAGLLVLAFGPEPGPVAADPGPGRPNNPWPETCDIDIGLVIDRSNSIAVSGAENPGLVRDATRAFAQRMQGTGARMAVWSFGTLASGYSGPNPFPPAPPGSTLGPRDYPSIGFTPLDADGVGRVHDVIGSIPFADGVDPVGFTNWEAGLGRSSAGLPGAIAPDGSRPADADVVVVFTDGVANLHNQQLADPGPLTGRRDDADVNAAIAASGLLKDAGARVVAVGVGDVDEPNLQRITGGLGTSTEGEDYWHVDFAGLADALFEASTQFCGGRIEVTKLEPGDQPGTWVPRAGWPFSIDFPDAEPPSLDPSAGPQETDGAGHASWQWISGAESTRVRISEQLASDEAVLGVFCAAESGAHWRFSGATFTLPVPRNDPVRCLVHNVPRAPALTVVKTPGTEVLPWPGGPVTFDVAVANPSEFDTVRLTGLTDDVYGDLTDADNPALRTTTCPELAGRSLDPGAVAACRFEAVVRVDEGADRHRDVVTVTGVEVLRTGGTGAGLTASDDAVVALEPVPDLTIRKDDGTVVVHPGEEVTYRLHVTNAGGSDATGVQVTDRLPPDASFVDASMGGRESAPGLVSWPTFDLPAGASVTLEVTVRVSESAVDGDEVLNRARVTDDGSHGEDPNPGNNEDEDLDEVDGPRAPGPRRQGSLPRTGAELAWLALAGASALVVGGGITLAVRRRTA